MFQNVLDPSVRSSLGNVTRWFLTLAHQPQVKAVVGDVTLAAAPPVYDANKFNELKKVCTVPGFTLLELYNAYQ